MTEKLTTKDEPEPKITRKEVIPESKPKIVSEVAAADDEDSEYQIIPVKEIAPRQSSGQRPKHYKNRGAESRGRNAKDAHKFTGKSDRQKPLNPHQPSAIKHSSVSTIGGPKIPDRQPSPSLRE